MSYFKAKMHQILFRLGLRPRPRGGAHGAPPYPAAGYNGSHLYKGNGGTEGKRMGRRGRTEKEGRGTERRNEEKRKMGGAESWNRAAEWLRPALIYFRGHC